VGIYGLQKLYQAGARGLLMRFETSNSRLYSKLRPGKTLENRLEHIREAFKMGYLIITGSLIGLPGQTEEDILNDILLTKDLHAEMFSFGPFIPVPDTPLANEQTFGSQNILKVLALSRIIDPENAKILVTTAFETIDPEARKKGLLSGANSVMLSVTPENHRKKYCIYPNRAHNHQTMPKQIDETISLLRSLGRAPTDLGIK
jgi:biotin synthase